MALVPSFTVESTIDPAALLLTDTSTGSDGAVTNRQILLYNSAGILIVPAIDWPITQSSITVMPLITDMALNIQINWNNNSGSPLYTKTQLFAATQYAELFYYTLTQQQAASSAPNILTDPLYFVNKSTLRTLIDSAVQAINFGADIYSAQFCIALYQPFLNTPNNFF